MAVYSSARGIYVVTTADRWPCKIGFTTNLEERLGQLQCGNWHKLHAWSFSFVVEATPAKMNMFLALLNDTHSFERIVHKTLRDLDLHLNGEWFDLDTEAADLVIRKCAAMNGYQLVGPDALLSASVRTAYAAGQVAALREMTTAYDAALRAIGSSRHAMRGLTSGPNEALSA